MQRSRSTVVTVLALVGVAGVSQAQLIRSGTSNDAAGLTPVVNTYRTDLGTLNPNQPGTFFTGRREINWDAVPDGSSAPNAFPGNFFNGPVPGRARGTVFSTPGSAFAVSADSDNPTATPRDFANINPTYTQTFEAFSPERLFTAIDSNVIDVNFFIAGSPVPAATRGFGAVFSDVDLANRTSIEYFDIFGNSLLVAAVPNVFEASGSFSFLGVSFADPIVGRVRITLGNAPLGADFNDGLRGDPIDLVVTDDFIYGEPVPTPGALGLLGLAGIAAARRRRA